MIGKPLRLRSSLARGTAAALLLVAVAQAQEPMPAQDFVNRTAVANMFGAEAATLALSKSSSAAIKAFAHRIADDQAVATSGLRRIVAKRSDIALPDRPDGRHLALLRDLAGKQGPGFDKAYVDSQLQTHRETAALVERYAKEGGDRELKGFAEQSLPVFRDLDRRARGLQAGP